jgi:predicted transcriptional regulator
LNPVAKALKWQSTGLEMAPMANFNFQIDASLASRLACLAERRDLSSDEIAEMAISEFVDRDESDLLEIEAGLADAKQGDFASDAEVNAVFVKYAISHSAK